MANALIVRPVEEGDLGAVAELLGQLTGYAHSSIELTIGRIRKLSSAMRDNPQRYKNLVACVNGVVVGFISILCYLSFLHEGGTALINELVVSNTHRRSGIGKALIQTAISKSKRDGLDEIEVGTEKDNKAAIAFYKHVGFDEEYVLLGKRFDSREDFC
jgi:ribosomal protein S18 acetylase RimI-like enzyme